MTSEKYITQLLQDVKAAHKNAEPKDLGDNLVKDDQDDMEAHFQDVENYLEFDDEMGPTFGEIIKLELIQFPKAEFLNKDQLERLFSAFTNLLDSYNVDVHTPEKMSLDRKYTITLGILNEAIFLTEEGRVGWDACNDEYDTCLYGEFCHCRDMDLEFEQNIEDARQLLSDIVAACDEFTESHTSIELKIGNPKRNEFNMLCMYLAGGGDHVPFEIYQNALVLNDACKKLQQLFNQDQDLISLFQKVEDYKVHKNLAVFLSLMVEKIEDNIIYVEPYYIEDGLIHKGTEPTFTPEEFMDKLESQNKDDFQDL